MKAAFLYKPVEASVPLVAIVCSDRSTRVSGWACYPNLVGSTRSDENPPAKDRRSIDRNLDVVSSGGQAEALEEAVEVVDRTSMRSIHIDSSVVVTRHRLDPDGSVLGGETRRRCSA